MKKEKRQKEHKVALKDRVIEVFDDSKEVLWDAPKITFIGNRELTVENYKSIVEYTDKKVVLEANPHRLHIEGSCLEIKSVAKELIYISGQIVVFSFKREV